MAKSSNIGTILAAERIGKRKFAKYLNKFGIGQPTGLGIPGENRGYVPPLENWSPTTFPTLAFGQGLSVNAVQAASVFATIANDGLKVQPRLVSGLIGADGTVTEPEVAPPTRVVSAEAAAQVRLMLEAVVGEGGTAQQAKVITKSSSLPEKVITIADESALIASGRAWPHHQERTRRTLPPALRDPT
jgi:cell division protein FtsI (penicillin-binding protein 3)